MHFMNPPALMPLVELIRGLETSDATVATVRAAAEAMGKTVAEARDVPGFLANRMLLPMLNEAAFCLYEGVGDAEAIDTVMRLGMNHPLGPLALADLIGLDTCLAILEVLHDGLRRSEVPALPAVAAVRRGGATRPQGRARVPRLRPSTGRSGQFGRSRRSHCGAARSRSSSTSWTRAWRRRTSRSAASSWPGPASPTCSGAPAACPA